MRNDRYQKEIWEISKWMMRAFKMSYDRFKKERWELIDLKETDKSCQNLRWKLSKCKMTDLRPKLLKWEMTDIKKGDETSKREREMGAAKIKDKTVKLRNDLFQKQERAVSLKAREETSKQERRAI